MSRFTQEIGKRIFYARKEQEITQEELAEITKLTANTISLIECGEVNTGFKNIYKICKALKIKMTDLFKGY